MTFRPIKPGSQRAVLSLLDELGVALERKDGDAAVLVLQVIDVVAGPAFGQDLLHHLLRIGTQRMLAGGAR